MSSPEWACIHHTEIDYQNIVYYSVPKLKKKLSDLNEVDQEILKTFEKLGINMPVGFGEVLFYSIIALNLIIFTALTRLFWE